MQTDREGLEYLDQLEIWKGGGGFGLDNITAVMKELGDPQDQIRSIHITGTNGKGSVSAAISSIIAASGVRVGLTISPHLLSVNERVIVDGEPISDQQLNLYAYSVKLASQRAGKILSFHEGLMAVAFVAFAELKLDWIVVEVGLGGRFDSSNILKRPEVTVITTVELDHQHILGATKAEIAYQKAGIIKPGVPVVVGKVDQECMRVIEGVASEADSRVFALRREFNCISIHDAGLRGDSDSLEFSFLNKEPLLVQKSLRGKHQLENVAVSLAVAKIIGIGDQSAKQGISRAFWPGRLEVFNWKNRVVLVDCAHNPHGVSSLVDNLKDWGVTRADVAFGVLDTKEWRSMVDMLGPLAASWSLLEPSSERALNMTQVQDYLSGIEVRSTNYGKDINGFISDHEQGSIPLVITGSIYLIGKVREKLGRDRFKVW